MNAPVLRSALLYLLGLVFSPSAFLHASPPADNLHHSLPFDYEQWKQERPAAKRLADLDVGEPRTVRMIYFLPNDRSYQSGVANSIKTTIRQLQTFYSEQMQAHGHGGKTFRFETDDQGEPLIHRVDGQRPDSHYLDDTMGTVLEEIEGVFDLEKNVYFVVIDNSIHAIGRDGSTPVGIATSTGKTGGLALFSEEFSFATAAHELTHAFGLPWHDFREDEYILSYGSDPDRLSDCSAGFLAVHPFFNPDVEAQAAPPPAIERVSPVTYPGGAESVSVELKVSDPDGLHQVSLFVTTGWFHDAAGSIEIKACRLIAGEEEAVVEFEYDGSTPSNVRTRLSNPLVHPITVLAVDTDGNVGWTSFDLLELSQQHIATLSGVSAVRSVSFSPDGATLASGTEGGVEIWEVATRKHLALLEQSGEIRSVAFSSDGTNLVSGSTDGTIELWENASASWTNIATLESQNPIYSVAFSPDGTTVASGTSDEVELWDVESETNTVTLEGHTGRVTSVAFSPDGTTLASGSEDGTVKLWDVVAGTRTATLEGHTQPVFSVAFSPQGTLASGSEDGTVRLWDVSSQTNTATLSRHPGGVASVAFSPDGETLASGSRNNTIKLWDVLTEEDVIILSGHTGGITSVAFSPDGAMLASGSLDNTINLWDASERMQPRPRMVVKISGDNQEGTPGADLADPYVVEVRDQYGNPLPDVPVTFSIRSGGGKLGGRSTEEVAVTDPEGLGQIILTLGPNPGANTVEATVRGLEPVTFHSVGAGTPGTLTEDDYQKWHLPDGTIARLGKGRLSQGEKAIAVSPGGQRLALVSAIGIWLYDMETFRPLALLPTGFNRFGSLAFSPDGTILASSPADKDRMTRLWDLATGEVITSMEDHTASPPVFSPDGTTLAAGLWDGTIKLWDVETGEEVITLEGHTDGVSSVAFSPDGSILLSGSWDHSLRLWDLGTQATPAILDGHTDVVESVAFSPDGTLLASGSWDGTLRLWDVETGTNTDVLERVSVSIESVVFSSDGEILAAAFSDGTVRVWDVGTATNTAILEGHSGPVESVVFSPDGTLVSGSWADGTVRLWDLTTGNAATLEGHADGVQSVAFSPDGRTLASGSAQYESTIYLWDAETGQRTASLDGHTRLVHSVAFSPDGTTLASASEDKTVKLWDVATGTNSATLEGHAIGVGCVAFSPDGTLASASGDMTVKLWDVATGINTATLEHSSPVLSVAFSRDGETLASSSFDGTVKLWDKATGTETATLEGHTGWVLSVAFSPDGTTLASGGGEGDFSIRWWDVASRKTTATSERFRGWIRSVAFTPDGAILASGSDDRTVRIWDAAKATQIATFEHTSWVNSVAFSPDGAILVSGAGDGTVLLWDMQLVVPGPRTLTKVSGDKQQGLPGAQLAEPFVVSVLDQNGDPLPGAEVAFSVTAGGGTLSANTTVTDANGRASITLTLGSEPGRNTVAARVGDLKPVIFSATAQAVPTSLTKVSGDSQQGAAGAPLSEPFVVSVLDQTGAAFAEATVTFAVTSGDGTLSTTTAATDEDGRAAATLTLGLPGDNTVTVSVAGLEPVSFTVTAEVTPDFDGDGETGFSDFFLFADAFGSSDPRFDLDGSGSVDFADFFLLADYFADPARGKLLALARERIGLPDGPQLQQNAPNPFNSETVITWFLVRPGSARVEVFALTGQRVAVLHQGPKKAGVHRLHWDGRDDRGRPLASGVYLYRLVTDERVQTRKLTLLR